MTLIGYWPLNESSSVTEAKDHSENENHGTINDGDDSTIPGGNGVIGQEAYSFDGNNDYVEVEDTASLRASDAVTMSCWIYSNVGSTSDWQGIVAKRDDSLSTSYGYGINFTQDEFQVYTENTVPNFGYNPPKNVWTYITGVIASSGIKLYVNAELYSEKTGAKPATNTAPVGIATSDTGQTNYELFDGKISEVRIYDRPLTQSEIQYLYSVGKRGLQTTGKKSS